MTVIPFDPSRRRGSEAQLRATAPEQTDLDAAKARIAMLERTLVATMRENARNWARAELAEARSAALEAELETLSPDRKAQDHSA